MSKKVRVRFAPSPTGGLHLGGVRTVLFNYLFAKHNDGEFILRIEDTDQTRYVEGAEQYIYDCLKWCGMIADESPVSGGDFGPYRQSERKAMYRQYAEQLVRDGYAYYAFDTQEELEQMRKDFKTPENPSPKYDAAIRANMRNSLSLAAAEVEDLLSNNTPHVIRIRIPENEQLEFNDIIRGSMMFDTSTVDDKVLLKADGMPTYHLAVVVDDYLMKISHAFRGEEWLPSAPVHLLLWRYLGWEADMPEWAHLPLILKPDGHGKLSKRDGQRLGFPVFALKWNDPVSGESFNGFKEEGFLPEAFINILALLGWKDSSEQEIFSIEELISKFSLERVHKGGAKFDYEKAKWFNQQYIQQKSNEELLPLVKPFIEQNDVQVDEDILLQVISLVKERCHLLTDFYEQSHFFFRQPEEIDTDSILKKWDNNARLFFEDWLKNLEGVSDWTAAGVENSFNEMFEGRDIKKGGVMLPLRIMLVGGKYGPGVFDIAALIGKEETVSRVSNGLIKIK